MFVSASSGLHSAGHLGDAQEELSDRVYMIVVLLFSLQEVILKHLQFPKSAKTGTKATKGPEVRAVCVENLKERHVFIRCPHASQASPARRPHVSFAWFQTVCRFQPRAPQTALSSLHRQERAGLQGWSSSVCQRPGVYNL